MCAEASSVLRAVAADFFFNCWFLEIPSNNRIRHIPRIQNHKSKKVRYIGQGEAQHRKYKRLKLGGGHVYGCSSVPVTSTA
jgi:hypothetical protein